MGVAEKLMSDDSYRKTAADLLIKFESGLNRGVISLFKSNAKMANTGIYRVRCMPCQEG
jgi:hypothetical protein